MTSAAARTCPESARHARNTAMRVRTVEWKVNFIGDLHGRMAWKHVATIHTLIRTIQRIKRPPMVCRVSMKPMRIHPNHVVHRRETSS